MDPSHESTEPAKINKARPPIAFAVANVQFLGQFPDGADELWSADVKASRHGVQCDVFEDVLFVESRWGGQETAFIYGIEFEDGYPHGLEATRAAKQQVFVQFLRQENAKDAEALGWTRKLFTGHEYSSEGKATAAYLAARDATLRIGVGYTNEEGEYELVAVESQEWVESARRVLPFDELGR